MNLPNICCVCSAYSTAIIIHVATDKHYGTCDSERCQEIIFWRSWGVDYTMMPTLEEMEAKDRAIALLEPQL